MGRAMLRLSRLIKLLPGVFMLGAMGAGLLLSLLNPATGEAPGEGELLSGELAASYQANYEREIPVRQAAVRVLGLVRYLLFREGLEGVLVGSDGWLFSTEEFSRRPGEEQAVAENLEYVRAVRDSLLSQGIELVVALVPAKARVYEDRLGRYVLPDYVRPRYRDFRRRLLDLGICTPDLLTALLEARRRAEVFLRTDTHWSPFGARTAAQALAACARRTLKEKGVQPVPYDQQLIGTRLIHGDLTGFIPLGEQRGPLGPRPDLVAEMEMVAANDRGLGLFDDPDIPVALIGSSYSAGRLWNFVGALKQALEADVLNVAAEGQGPFLPMQAYLASDTFREITPRLIIWEIPERCLPVSYSLSAPAAGRGEDRNQS
jgi:alginate O-acetyltransferase complex protein AlgJ